MAFLEGPSLKQAEVIKQELGEGPDDLERGVRDLLSMCAASSHLPNPDFVDKNLLKLFVRGCRMNLQRARKKFETFCISRTRCPDIYQYKSLTSSSLKDVTKFIDIVPLPKLTDEGYRVTVYRIRPDYPEHCADLVATCRAIYLIADTRMHDETLIAGDVFVWETSNLRGSLASKLASSVGAIRRSIQLAQGAYPQRMKQIHVVGAPGYIAAAMQLMRSLVNEKIKKRYYIHDKAEDLLEHFPAHVLPVEWGGREESIEVLAKKWMRRVDECREYLQDLSEYSNVPPAIETDNDIYGTVGAFRKLDID